MVPVQYLIFHSIDMMSNSLVWWHSLDATTMGLNYAAAVSAIQINIGKVAGVPSRSLAQGNMVD